MNLVHGGYDKLTLLTTITSTTTFLLTLLRLIP